MTTANKITLARIALIPVFVLLAVFYGGTVADGSPQESLRWWAVAAFAVASLSDGLDGWVARRWNQRTELGVILDPIADKGLLLAAVITLGFSHWAVGLPRWFAVLVVTRDVVVLAGTLVLILLEGKVAVRPTWTGKAATALQMITLIFVMLEVRVLEVPLRACAYLPSLAPMDVLVGLTAFFTTASCVGYWVRGVTEVHQAGHGQPVAWPQSSGFMANPIAGLGRISPNSEGEPKIQKPDVPKQSSETD